MGAINKRGVWVPGANDDLLAGWQTMAGQIGAYVPVASVAAARALLDEAQTAGMGPTTSNPMLFLVGSGVQKVAYVSDGTKNNSVWVLAPLNEVEVDERIFAAGTVVSLTSGQYINLANTALPARPYARVFTATGSVYGAATGSVEVCLRSGAEDMALGSLPVSSGATITVTNSVIVPANTAPSLQIGVRGGGASGGKVTLAGAQNLNRLIVTAYPITMSA